MNERERLDELVAAYGEMTGQALSPDAAGACVFRYGESGDSAHFEFLADSGCVVLWATVGFLAPDRNAPLRVVRLLQMQDLGGEADGFTLGAEPGKGRVVIAARRAVADIADATSLAGWVDGLVAAVEAVRDSLREDFPVEMEDFDLSAVDLGDEDDLDEAEDDGGREV